MRTNTMDSKQQNEPLRAALYDWLMRNFDTPTDTSSVIVFILIIILAWYIINWIIKFVFSLFWPIAFLVGLYVFLPHFQQGTLDKIIPNMMETGKEVHIMGYNVYDIIRNIRE